MVEALWYPSRGHQLSDALTRLEVSDRPLSQNSLSSIRGESKKELTKKGGFSNGDLHVPPRRAFTISDYLLPTAPVSRVGSPSASPREPVDRDSYFQLPVAPPTPVRSPCLSPVLANPSVRGPAVTQRPSLPSAHRSYSVTDYEPIPFTHRPGTTLTLPQLPPELHYAVFDFLDPIDSVCLALTSRHFYEIYRKMPATTARGKVSLAARREGPNDMEWVWRNAGPFVLQRDGGGAGRQNSLAMLSPRGQVYCRRCRTARCELHKHIREWMGDGLEYCPVTEKYGPPAREGASGFCYRSSPRHPHRCGRHTRNQRTVRLV
ncbi:hypothetical protein F5Y19DRAFT_480217 [Xylariaceae sp. FL1651]|nr:hypothetical protein F5Y19DRAFT_480217 [Xylariaceae sp. FL1651]